MDVGRRRRKDTEVIGANGKVDKKASYYTISVRFPKAWEHDLKDIAFEERYQGGITEYINELVRRDLVERKMKPKKISQLELHKLLGEIRNVIREYEDTII